MYEYSKNKGQEMYYNCDNLIVEIDLVRSGRRKVGRLRRMEWTTIHRHTSEGCERCKGRSAAAKGHQSEAVTICDKRTRETRRRGGCVGTTPQNATVISTSTTSLFCYFWCSTIHSLSISTKLCQRVAVGSRDFAATILISSVHLASIYTSR